MAFHDCLSPRRVLSLRLFGPFQISDCAGDPIILRSLKSQGLIALLATTPTMTRSRAWICDKLWSDRDAEHAASSLRQALAEIRRGLGPFGDVLGADRRNVWLDRNRVYLDPEATGEFLEGIDIRDSEWDHWLQERRLDGGGNGSRRADGTHGADKPAARVSPEAGEGADLALGLVVERDLAGESRFLGGVVAEALARNLSEQADYDVRIGGDATMGLHLSVSALQSGAGSAVSLALRSGAGGGHIWAGSRRIKARLVPGIEETELSALLAEAQDALLARQLSTLPRFHTAPSAAVLTQIAARKILTFDAVLLREAETILEEICAGEPTAVQIGWLLFLNRIMIFERMMVPTQERVERLVELCTLALSKGATNAFVMAAVSGLYLRTLKRPSEAFELARRAVRLNPSNPFAIDALASAMYLQGQVDDGYRLSRAARLVTANTRIAHFFEMSLCLASLLSGRLDEAADLANSAVAMAPNFRAAWRYRIGLSAHRNCEDDVWNSRARLLQLEDDFSIERIATDPDYPVAALRKAGIGLGRLLEMR